MSISILIVDGTRFSIGPNADDVKRSITDALREGGGFVTITTTNGRHTDVLITSAAQAKIEYPTEPETDDTVAGASLPEPFIPDDFATEYGL
ncbi:hypothetical protein ACFVWR_01310 [Leifsonia sp. NPDC058292]|uniref:hypothetical protein n=1 Tax=Leifsonia sp. NPDC058292 TaxID=3346428 RepID=UPI0036DEA2E2